MFATGVGIACLGLQDAESTVTANIQRVNNTLRVILASILLQELERKSSLAVIDGEGLFVRHFTYSTIWYPIMFQLKWGYL